MAETEFSFSQIESPAPGSVLAPGRHRIDGWVWPRAGGILADVRARVGSRLFPAIHGFPRADLAAHFQTGQPVALAAFSAVVNLAPGPVAIIFEALEIEGRWSAFQTVTYQVDAALPAVDFAVPTAPLRWHEFGRALQALLRLQRRHATVPLAVLARDWVSDVPYPRDLQHAPAPFHGHLDEPAALARVSFGRTPVLGYLFHETQPIRRVLATFDLQTWQPVEHQQASPAVAGYFPDWPNARACMLYGLVDVPAQLPQPVTLRLYAELADGSLQLCCVQRSRLITTEDEKSPYPAQATAPLAATVSELRQALAARSVVLVEDDALRNELTRIETDVRLRAPQVVQPTPALRAAPATSDAPWPRRILVVSHNLELEGAPLFLVDYVAHLLARGAHVTVLSPLDGPLRARFTQLGAAVAQVEADTIFAAPTATRAQELIRNLAFDFAPFDLVVCNTFTTFWAVHAAKAAGRPVLLYVHESTTPASFYHSRAAAEVIALVDAAFGLADAVSFTTASTRGYHTDYGRPATHRLTPGWIDVSRIDAWRAQHPRDELRRPFNLRPGELLVTNVGTVSGRKGQHIFARAVDLLWRRHPALAARTKFVMLGGRHSPFDAMLAELLGQLQRPNLSVVPETPDYFPYYAAADLFVCSSYEESSPRVILETMACATPILSSGVQGVPELVRSDLEATLVPPGDPIALAEAMAKLLLSPAIGEALAARARARVVSEFEAAILLPRHAALAAEVAAGRIT